MPAGKLDFRAICGRFLAQWTVFMSKRIKKRSRKQSVQDSKEIRSTKTASAIHELLSYLAFCLLPALVYSSKDTLLSAVYAPFSGLPVTCLPYDTATSTDFDSSTMPHDIAGFPAQPFIVSSVYGMYVLLTLTNLSFSFWRLTLSGDVESNPGPVTGESADIGKHVQDALREFESKISVKISSMESSLQKQVSEILHAIKFQGEALEKIRETQTDMQNSISSLCQDLATTNGMVERNTTKIEELSEAANEAKSTVSDLHDQIDRLESFSRRNNVKFFGIPESEGAENNEDCAEAVRRILQTYMPKESWTGDVIDRAHRLGAKQNSRSARPRPVIAKFLRWSDVMSLMKDREARAQMKKDDLTVTQDLTRRQSAILKELREEGKVGYFSKGKLHVRNSNEQRRPISSQPRPSDSRAPSSQPPVNASRRQDVSTRSRPATSDRRGNPPDRAVREPRAGSVSPPPISAGTSDDDTAERESPPVRRPSDSSHSGAQDRGRRTRSAANSERQSSLREAWGTKDKDAARGNARSKQR